jgi:hypothetical protein
MSRPRSLLRVVPGETASLIQDFELGFVDSDGAEQRVPLSEATGIRLEDCLPVRSFPSFKGQRNFPGLWWSATMGRHVGFESWLERDHAMLLDFDPRVVAFAPQPFWLLWPELADNRARVRSHAPDWFARLDDDTGVVVDCRPVERRAPRDAAAFAATERACAAVGWGYRLVGAPDPVFAANLRWLAGYRHPRHLVRLVASRLLEVFATPRPLMDGARKAGEPIAVLPVLYHLLWLQRLAVDLSVRLEDTSLVWLGEESCQ